MFSKFECWLHAEDWLMAQQIKTPAKNNTDICFSVWNKFPAPVVVYICA